jgi:hypothetical protein
MLGICFFKDGSGLPPQGRGRLVPLAIPPGEGHLPNHGRCSFGASPHACIPRGDDPPYPPMWAFAQKAFWWFLRLGGASGPGAPAVGLAPHEVFWWFLRLGGASGSRAPGIGFARGALLGVLVFVMFS